MKNGDYVLVIAPNDYPGVKYRDKYCYEHHLVYWQHYGVVPNKDEVIHHKDGNKHNNDINNLILLTKAQHDDYHNHLRKHHLIMLKCPTCNKLFIIPYRQSHIVKKYKASYCSKECANKANTLRNNKDELFLQRIKENVVYDFYA